MDPNLIGGLVVLVLGTLIVGVVNRMQESRHKQDMELMQKRYDTDMAAAQKRYDDDMAKAATALAAMTVERDAAIAREAKERAERERWWRAYTDEATAHLKTRTEMQDSIDAMEDKIRTLSENADLQNRTIAELNTKADEQHRTISELNETVARLTAELQTMGGGHS